MSEPAPPLDGTCDPAFGRVRDVLAASLARGDDLGAGVTAWVGDRCVLDLRGGYTDRKKTAPFGDTLVCVYSCGKAITAALVMAAVETGHLDYDRPVATDWPEFAAAGKANITLAQALSHQGGLAAFTDPIEPSLWIDWEATCAALAAMPPLWTPGEAAGYHPQTFGYIAGEVLRRATGHTIGRHLRALSDDVMCGLGPAAMARVGAMLKPPAAPDLGELTPLKTAAFLSPWSAAAGVGRDAWMAAEIPASNMHATSAGLANIMRAFATRRLGPHTISRDVHAAALAERSCREDLVLPFELSWGAGVMRNHGEPLGPSPTAIGHYGFGGACVVADPAAALSFAYVPNKMSPHLVRDPRALNLIEAVYDAL